MPDFISKIIDFAKEHPIIGFIAAAVIVWFIIDLFISSKRDSEALGRGSRVKLNLDDEKVYDPVKKKWLLPFSTEQQSFIMENNLLDIPDVLYPSLSVQQMRGLALAMANGKTGIKLDDYSYDKAYRLARWKLMHSPLSIGQIIRLYPLASLKEDNYDDIMRAKDAPDDALIFMASTGYIPNPMPTTPGEWLRCISEYESTASEKNQKELEEWYAQRKRERSEVIRFRNTNKIKDIWDEYILSGHFFKSFFGMFGVRGENASFYDMATETYKPKRSDTGYRDRIKEYYDNVGTPIDQRIIM